MKKSFAKVLMTMAVVILFAVAASNVAYAHSRHHGQGKNVSVQHALCYLDGACAQNGSCDVNGGCQNGGYCTEAPCYQDGACAQNGSCNVNGGCQNSGHCTGTPCGDGTVHHAEDHTGGCPGHPSERGHRSSSHH